MILDNRLSWNQHIKYIRDKCQSALNLMRCISGQNWGADKTSLLRIYRAFIRSKLDYGSMAYQSASESTKKQLDTIQAAALKICCGATKGTPIAALQVECGEMPLDIRRVEQSLKYSAKLETFNEHQTKCILQPAWKSRRVKRNRTTFLETIEPHMDGEQVQKIDFPHTPPWQQIRPVVNTTLHNQIDKKNTDLTIMRQLTLTHIHEHQGDKIAIFTDGSRNENGRVGGAIYSKQLQTTQQFRITDHNSILTAELVAIHRAITIIKASKDINHFIIFTDSLAAAQTIETGSSNSKPHLIEEISSNITELAKLGRTGEIHWLPSHIEIEGNEEADKAAKASLNHPTIDVEIKPELHDIYPNIERKTLGLWQVRWDNDTKGRHYHQIQPEATRQIKFIDRKNRARETLLTRLQLGRCGLKHYLHQMKKDEDGNCIRCKVEETVQHWLIECPGNVHLQQQLKHICRRKSTDYNIRTVLNDAHCLEEIYNYAKEHNTNI